MKCCVSVYLQLLVACLQKKDALNLMRKLIKAVKFERKHDYPIDSNDLRRYKKCENSISKPRTNVANLATFIEDAQNADVPATITAFSDSIIGLIQRERYAALVSYAFEILKNEPLDKNTENFKYYFGVSKDSFLKSSQVVLPDFLAKLFLYSLTIDNKEGRGCLCGTKGSKSPCPVADALTAAHKKHDKNNKQTAEGRAEVLRQVELCDRMCVLQIVEERVDRYVDKWANLLVVETLPVTAVNVNIGDDVVTPEKSLALMAMAREQHDSCPKCFDRFEYINNGMNILCEEVMFANKTFLVCPKCAKILKFSPESEYERLWCDLEDIRNRDSFVARANRVVYTEELNNLVRDVCKLFKDSEVDPSLLDYEDKNIEVPARVEEKIQSSRLRNSVIYSVDYCYGGIRRVIGEIKDENTPQANNITNSFGILYDTLKKSENSQEVIFNQIVDILRRKTGKKYLDDDYRTVVSYFVAQCAIFEKPQGREMNEISG